MGFLAACSKSDAPDQSTASGSAAAATVTFWKVPSQGEKEERAFFAKIGTDFKTATGNTMNYQLMPWDNASTKLTAAYAGGNGPDLAYLILPWINQYRESGALLALEDVGGNEVGTYLSGASESVIAGSKGKDGKTYGLPIITANFFLAQNDDIWEKAGKPTPPTTFEEMIPFAEAMTFDKAGKNLKDPGFDAKRIANYGMLWPTDPGLLVNYVFNYLWGYGTDYVNEAGDDIGFGNAEGEAALKVMKAMVDSGAATPASVLSDPNYANYALLNAKVGMAWSPLLNKQDFDKYPKTRVSVIGIPTGPVAQATLGGVGYLSIAAKTKAPKAAWELLKSLVSEENMKAYCTSTLLFPGRDIGPIDYTNGQPDNKAAVFDGAAAATAKYVRLSRVLTFQPENFLVGKFNDYLAGRKTFDQIASECSAYVKTQAANAK